MSSKIITNAVEGGAGSHSGRSYGDSRTYQVLTAGDPTAVTVTVFGTLGQSGEWDELARHNFTEVELGKGHAMFHVANRRLNQYKVEITTLSGGTSPTVTVWEGG